MPGRRHRRNEGHSPWRIRTDDSFGNLIVAREISALAAQRLVCGREELGFLDMRESGPHSEGHPLFAASLPYSVLEARIGELAPNRTAPLLLIDGGDATALAAAEILEDMGYASVAVVDGGTAGWEQCGLTLYEGVHVPSKTLGELAYERFEPPTIEPLELYEWQRQGKDFSLLDCRPAAEFAKKTVPGATCMPTGEILHRLSTLATDAPIVLTCAGRTRGIIGACSLALVAPTCEVVALENGTQGWALAGRELERGAMAESMPHLSGRQAEKTRSRAKEFISKFKIAIADANSAENLRRCPSRTTYFFDVRSEEETALDPLDAFRPFAAGQLLQATELAVGVMRSRLVLADCLGLRAAVAAFWLRVLGYDARVAFVDDEIRSLPAAEKPKPPSVDRAELDAESCLSEVRSGAARLLDVRPSGQFSRSCVEGSAWCSRPRIRELSTSCRWLILGGDGPQAELAAREFSRLGGRDYAVVRGGFEALRSAGAPIRKGIEIPASDAVDEASFARGRHDGDMRASRRYLDWETGLVSRLSTSERDSFAI